MIQHIAILFHKIINIGDRRYQYAVISKLFRVLLGFSVFLVSVRYSCKAHSLPLLVYHSANIRELALIRLQDYMHPALETEYRRRQAANDLV